jgi:zinc protease
MSRRCSSVGWLARALALAALAPALAAPPPGYLHETLANGLHVSIVPDATMPIVATQVWYHVGSANEEPQTRGFAHLFEHMMFGGTATRPKRAVWDHHEAFGGETNAYTAFDETVYTSEIPPVGFPGLIALEADRMVHLSLTEENLANEKRIVTEELRVSTENDPWSRLFVRAFKELLGDHPYALTPAGTKEDIAAATLDHSREFYRRYYRPRNAHVIVVGPVDAAATLSEVEREFGPLPAEGDAPHEVPPIYGWPFPEALELKEDLPPVEIAVVGFVLPAPGGTDAAALEVLQEILTGGALDPFEDELVRKRHRAIDAGTEIHSARRGGVIAFYAASLPYRRRSTAFRHLDETREVLGRFEWLDETRLAAAKRKLERREAQRAYHAASIADAIGRAAWWEGDEARAFDETERLSTVTLEQVRAAYRHYVLEPRPIRLYLRPEHVPLGVRLFGWLYPIFGGG